MSSDPVRWSGLAAVAGGVDTRVDHPRGHAFSHAGWPRRVATQGGHREGWDSFNLWSGVALMLTMIGLTGAHLRQVRRIGGIGHAGFVLPWTGTASMGAGRLGQLVEIGGTWILVILGAFALISGVVLFGIATLRAKVFPSAAGLLLSAAGLMLFPVGPENRRAFLALL